jgi:glycosyltransferase involved in cell wall biosynthesis
LARAITSVRRQDYTGTVEHLVIIDDDPASEETLGGFGTGNSTRKLRWHLERRAQFKTLGVLRDRDAVYPRMARLLNWGISHSPSEWFAFLDDDNAYEPDHLSSLMECARTHRCEAVHSARQMMTKDGAPYLEPYFPGARNAEEGSRIFELMCQRGVWIRGTNILQDRVDAVQSSFRNSTVMSNEDPVFLVDQNLWLVKRSLLQRFPIPDSFSEDEIRANTCPDDKFLEVLVRHRVKIAASRRPTVRYYLGGISNGFEREAARQMVYRPQIGDH